jgi:hypothetical protein
MMKTNKETISSQTNAHTTVHNNTERKDSFQRSVHMTVSREFKRESSREREFKRVQESSRERLTDKNNQTINTKEHPPTHTSPSAYQ